MEIQIPIPCHEDWENMHPGEQGRFCNACCKTVIDFTGMSPEAIRTYLKEHRSQRVCGRFTGSQLTGGKATALLSLTRSVLQSALSYTRKLAAIFLLLFAFSQDAQAQTTRKTARKDSVTIAEGAFLGRIAICPAKPEPFKIKTLYKTERLAVLKSDSSTAQKKFITTGIVVLDTKQ
ncbi:hypothetical protein [Niabella drilacis]|uniref:Uncharacterized protein n=1 Tax=Niabella drilacis (strain DSM 25811 / CCM 8410 / CCUG 62505 / LMG 26954 / E90) TaxID=1285928 RepID=A0A1G6Y8U9_NIADE|nr:hypothetical protein [Niabella drilacis]SDD86157.1 hypothetical protein SAMN04487894_1155 [Niabella drilacis]